jgi:hypothetical protein
LCTAPFILLYLSSMSVSVSMDINRFHARFWHSVLILSRWRKSILYLLFSIIYLCSKWSQSVMAVTNNAVW